MYQAPKKILECYKKNIYLQSIDIMIEENDNNDRRQWQTLQRRLLQRRLLCTYEHMDE